MRIGLHIGKFDWPGSPDNIGSKLSDIAQTADQAGLYSLWVMDHLFQLSEVFGIAHGPIDANMLEGYSVIAYLAGLTQRIKLGLMVTCNLYREPGLLVKTVSSIDVLSGGRTYFGIGAGWFEREAKGLGLPMPTWRERYERLEETLQITRHMWSGDRSAYAGKYYHLAEPINVPQPLSRPHPPIMVGGEGEKKTLRLVARYADACNFVVGAPWEELGVLKTSYEDGYTFLKHKLSVLAQRCQEVGRPYEEIEKTVITYLVLAPGRQRASEVVELCFRMAELGFEHVIFNVPNVDEIVPLHILGNDVIPHVAHL